MLPASEKRYVKLSALSIIALFLLILAGGIVRSSGAGMGCPDWPKCFGRYIPPMSASQLPNAYKESYVQKRIIKNNRLAHALATLGFQSLADKIQNNQEISIAEDFNAFKSWTEYINRLIGVIAGILLLICAFLSITYIQLCRKIFFLNAFNLLLIGFQGWLGSIVVSTNLLPWMVTLHMLIAMAIITISIYTYFKACVLRNPKHRSPNMGVKVLIIFGLSITLAQILLGTTVREQVDKAAQMMHFVNRAAWIPTNSWGFFLHRNVALLMFITHIVLFVMIRLRYVMQSAPFKIACYILIFLILQIITGITMAYLALPKVAQAIHVFLATLIFGAQFYLFLMVKTLYPSDKLIIRH